MHNSINCFIITTAISLGFSNLLFSKNTASIDAFGLQASLGVASSSWGATMYFTTYDASNSYPLNDNGTVSGELKAISRGSSVFVTDYLSADSSGVFEYGSVSINFPETDTDNNGVPDWLQKNMSVNINVTGSSELHFIAPGYNSGSASLSGTLTRSAGSASGNYQIIFNIAGLGEGRVTGTWYTSYYSGTIEYDEDIYSINAQTINQNGLVVSATGSSEYSIDTATDELNLAPVNLDVDGDNVQLQSMLFERSNSSYYTFANAIDGTPATSWADFTDWYIEILDSNDADNDGNPDFSDLDRSVSSIPTKSADGWVWIKWPWAYSDYYKSWFYFYPTGFGQISLFSVSENLWYSWNSDSGNWESAK